MAPSADDVTIPEMWRRLSEFQAETNRRFDGLNNHLERQSQALAHQIERLQFVPRGEYEVQINALKAAYDGDVKALTSRVSELEGRETWRNRAIASTFIFPLLVGLVIAYAMAGPR